MQSGTEDLGAFIARERSRERPEAGEGGAQGPYPGNWHRSRAGDPRHGVRTPPPGWHGAMYRYAVGGGEITACWRREAPEGPRPGAPDRELSEEERADNRRRAGARAAAVVRRIVLNAGHDHLGTLTFPGEGVQDFDLAAELVTGFMHRMGHLEVGRDYVMVPELHPGGHGWHWHFTCRGRRDAVRLRFLWSRWLRIRGWTINTPSGTARVHLRYLPTSAAASYLAKYLSKTFGEVGVDEGRHRYRVGRDTPRPEREAILVGSASAEDVTGLERLAQTVAGPGTPLGWYLFPTSAGLVVRISWRPAPPPRLVQVRNVIAWGSERIA